MNNMLEEIKTRWKRGYNLSLYGTREVLHQQMNDDIYFLLNLLTAKKETEMKIYKQGSEIPYIFIDELPQEEQGDFEKWLFGSTAPLIEGQEHRSTGYLSDYDRFKRWRNKIK